MLRYRRIPHVWRIPSGPPLEQNGELAKTGKDVLPILRKPEGTFHRDSTPLILDGLVGAFSAQQRSVLEFVGGPPENAPVHLHLYETLLAALEKMFEQSLFLFGSRPSLADFSYVSFVLARAEISAAVWPSAPAPERRGCRRTERRGKAVRRPRA